MTWMHPICDGCWAKGEPGRRPQFSATVDEETCCFCGRSTRSGLIVHANPMTEPVRSFCHCPEAPEVAHDNSP